MNVFQNSKITLYSRANSRILKPGCLKMQIRSCYCFRMVWNERKKRMQSDYKES